LGVYRVEEIIKEKFVANAVQVEMQRRHFYIACRAIKAANATSAYQTKYKIVDINMV
jgi:hypothetical protein